MKGLFKGMLDFFFGGFLIVYFCCSTDLVNALKIGTHSGKFHCDEVLGVALLQYLPEYSDAEIIRTRDNAVLADCDIVIDVGGVFDHDKKRYDHHQPEFQLMFFDGGRTSVTKLSSAGLVFKFYGKRILAVAFGVEPSDLVDMLHDKLYKNFVESIDAIDNGVSMCNGPCKYFVSTDLSHRVGRLNPAWNNVNQDPLSNFMKAVQLAREELEGQLGGLLNEWWPARDIVRAAIMSRKELHSTGQIISLRTPCPFLAHLYELEAELQVDKPILYALFQDSSSSSWRVRAIGARGEHFGSRCPLPESLRGLTDDALSKAAGIGGLIFIHKAGFIGGATTQAAALELAVLSLGNADAAKNAPRRGRGN
eukprot:GHVQ01017180.1.p1 GENE.GHVQ01017180.1~~GHVQ01017180.1.p1  ORF type:complete len:416 (+),score=38.07 GHVQ01017180.1:154-1248(+)